MKLLLFVLLLTSSYLVSAIRVGRCTFGPYNYYDNDATQVRGSITFTEHEDEEGIIDVVIDLKNAPIGETSLVIRKFGDIVILGKGTNVKGVFNPNVATFHCEGQDRDTGLLGNYQVKTNRAIKNQLTLHGMSLSGSRNSLIGRSVSIHRKAMDCANPHQSVTQDAIGQCVIGIADIPDNNTAGNDGDYSKATCLLMQVNQKRPINGQFIFEKRGKDVDIYTPDCFGIAKKYPSVGLIIAKRGDLSETKITEDKFYIDLQTQDITHPGGKLRYESQFNSHDVPFSGRRSIIGRSLYILSTETPYETIAQCVIGISTVNDGSSPLPPHEHDEQGNHKNYGKWNNPDDIAQAPTTQITTQPKKSARKSLFYIQAILVLIAVLIIFQLIFRRNVNIPVPAITPYLRQIRLPTSTTPADKEKSTD